MRLTLTLLLAGTAVPALADTPRVVTDTPVVGSLAAQVMGDLGAPTVLLETGANAHSFQLRPSQARALAEADLLFWVGPELTPWLERAIGGVGLSGEAITLLRAQGVSLRGYDEVHDHDEDHDEDHDGDHAHDDHDDDHDGDHDGDHAHDDHADDDDHAHDGRDPHAWLDPGNAMAWVDAIAAELSHHDPDHAAAYAANAAAARDRIAALDVELAHTLDGLGDVPLVMFHDAYGYFAAHFGLNVVGTIALGDAASPGAARLAAIRETLADTGAACVFPEAQHDPALVEVVVEGTGARIGGLLDPSGTTLAYGPEHYATLLRGLADTIAACARDAG